jgi:hypothetical protein
MKALRHYISGWLFNQAARLYPTSGQRVGQAHHVGDMWLEWTIIPSR